MTQPMTQPIPAELGEIQDMEFSSAQAAIAYRPARDGLLDSARRLIIGKNIEGVQVNDGLRLLITGNVSAKISIVNRLVELEVVRAVDPVDTAAQSNPKKHHFLWHPVDPNAPLEEGTWDQPSLIEQLVGQQIAGVGATDVCIWMSFENRRALLCAPCRYRRTGEYFVYWDFE